LLPDNSNGSDMTALRLLPSFPAECWPSGPRRQGFASAAPNAPLTAPGRSEPSPLGKKVALGKKTKNKLDTDRPSHGRRDIRLAPKEDTGKASVPGDAAQRRKLCPNGDHIRAYMPVGGQSL